MILTNWLKLLRIRTVNASLSCRDVNGVWQNFSSEDTSTINIYYSGLRIWSYMERVVTSYTGGGYGIVLGVGDAAPTPDDYKLSGNVIAALTSSVIRSTESLDDGGNALEALITLTNGNSYPITVRECGIVAPAAKGTASYASLMIERTVLSSPITIPANGGVGQIKYRIEMAPPTGL